MAEQVKETPEQIIEAALVERFDKERVDNWKKSFAPRKLTVIEVEGKFAVLRPITARELSHYSMLVADSEAGGLDVAAKYLLDELWIDGDNCVRDDEEYFMAAMLQIQSTIEVKKSLSIKL